MKLIERYVYDVTRRLPEKQRDEVSRELLSEIHDMVEDRAKGRVPTKKQVQSVLGEMGSPSKLADGYREKPGYLIGPEYYEAYVSLLKTLLLVIVPILLFIVWMSEALSSGHSILTMGTRLFGVAFGVSLHIFFWTTVSFWIVQKMANGRPSADDWTPNDLPNLPPPQEIGRSESFIAIAWSAFAIVATVSQIPAVHQLLNRSDTPQFFAPSMWSGWTLGLLLMATLGLAAELWKLYVRGWTRSTVGVIIAVNIATIIFFWLLMTSVDPIVNPALTQLIADSLQSSDIVSSITLGVRIVVYFIIALCVWEIGEAIYKYKKGGER